MFEEDLEEMKYLREIGKKYEAIEKRQTVSYKFELNRNTKTRETVPNLKGLKHESIDQTDHNEHVHQIMGFSNFGRIANKEKTAQKFDVEQIVTKTQQNSKWKPMDQSLQTQQTNDDSDSSGDEKSADSGLKQDFGQHSDKDSESDSDLIGPPLPPHYYDSNEQQSVTERNDDDNDSVDSDSDSDYNRYETLPITEEIELTHGNKSVTALALDPNGSRIVSGGVDYEIRFWDFQGMDSSLQSFRAITPCESHPIKNLEFSTNGDVILVISGACIAKIVDRDGFVKGDTIKGDQYITDMSHTKGHVAMLNDGVWHPRLKEQFATCSNDGTCRIWDLNNLKQHKSIIKPRSLGGLRATPNSCKYSRNGELICVGCNDGSIQMWDTRKNFVNTSCMLRDAHQKGTEITCIQFSYDSTNLLSRGIDGTLKLWDVKMLKKAVLTKDDLFNRFSMTDCFFSPDDRLVATGVSCQKGEQSSSLLFFSKDNFELKYDLKASKGSVIRSSWHPKLNQIIVGSSNGEVKVYYDIKHSERGAKLCVFKHKRKYRESYEIIEPQIITPHALPLFKTERKKSWRVQMMKARKDPVKSRRPELPMTGPGQGGRIASAGNTFASFIARNLGVKNKINDAEDPREALLKHAKEAAENPYWVTPAYAATQPQPIFSQNTKDNEDEDEEPAEKKPHIPV